MQMLSSAEVLGLAIAVASLLLAVIGLAVVLGGVYAFMNFRGIARRQAREEAATVSRQVAEATAVAYIQAELPALIDETLTLYRNAGTDEQADEIALAQEDPPPLK